MISVQVGPHFWVTRKKRRFQKHRAQSLAKFQSSALDGILIRGRHRFNAQDSSLSRDFPCCRSRDDVRVSCVLRDRTSATCSGEYRKQDDKYIPYLAR